PPPSRRVRASAPPRRVQGERLLLSAAFCSASARPHPAQPPPFCRVCLSDASALVCKKSTPPSATRIRSVSEADWAITQDIPFRNARTEKAKASRAQLQVPHTSGSVSYACSEHALELELGRPPRRDENYIKTHTRKDGVPSKQAEPIINQLKEIVEAHPELKERTIQEGDAFAAVCGPKEPKGCVRVLGLGPTPQDV
ncbi:hypothetical protein EJB05_14734, partial [Eragrostis curvula]